jgi:hypothetical protein
MFSGTYLSESKLVITGLTTFEIEWRSWIHTGLKIDAGVEVGSSDAHGLHYEGSGDSILAEAPPRHVGTKRITFTSQFSGISMFNTANTKAHHLTQS